MSCPSELEWSMYADQALSADESAKLEAHSAACNACAALRSALCEESRQLRAALQEEEAGAPIPEFHAPSGHSGALAAAAAVIALASSSLALMDLTRVWLLPDTPAWLNPFTTARAIDFVFGVLVFLVTEARSMVMSVIEIAGAALLVAVLFSAAYAVVRKRAGPAALSIALSTIVLSSPGHALEIRRDEQLLAVPAGETVDDTLIAFGQDIEIDGIVTGDLIAFGQRVVIRGDVQGQLVTGARSVDIEGEVGGSVLGFAETISVANAAITRNLFGFARRVTTADSASIGGNAVVFAANATLTGPVETDIVGFVGEMEVGGMVGGDLTAHVGSVRLLPPARIGGDVVAHVRNEDALQVSPGAEVGGTTSTEIRDGPDAEPEERVVGAGFLGLLVRFAAAFVAGLIVLWLVTPLRRLSLEGAGETVTAAGVGLVTLVAVPIIALMTAITLIGLPIAVLGVLLWLVGLYFAKIVLAHLVGRKLLDRLGRPHHFALALLVGLVLVFIAISLPFIGLVLNFLLTITGLGLLVIFVWGLFQER